MRPEIHELLGLPEMPETGLQWHALISSGFAVTALSALAEGLGVSDKHLADLLDVKLPQARRAGLLGREQSNMLYRTAKALAVAIEAHGGDRVRATEWLRSAQPMLKGIVPMLMLRSPLGTDYVLVAIARHAEAQGIALEISR